MCYESSYISCDTEELSFSVASCFIFLKDISHLDIGELLKGRSGSQLQVALHLDIGELPYISSSSSRISTTRGYNPKNANISHLDIGELLKGRRSPQLQVGLRPVQQLLHHLQEVLHEQVQGVDVALH